MSESQNIEWKKTWRDEYLKWICGFTNAQGGVLEIGKNDRGEVVGVKGILQLLEETPNKVQALLSIVVDVNLKSEDGREYLEIAVDPYPNPISYKGEFHYRSGSTKQVLRGAALSRFLLQKYGRTWDDAPLPGVGLKDLDSRVFDRFRRRGADSERLPRDILDESNERVIERLQLREASFLRRAAVLLFHPAPDRFVMEAYVKIGYFRGSELLYQDVVEGDLFTQVDRTMDLLYTKYTKALISYDGVYRVETFPVPREAMREAVINAIIHRDYASPTTIQIRVYDDRVAIWNAVQLPPEWTAAGQRTGEFSSKPYNPRIAYAFFRAGMIEAWGRGIRRIVEMCKEAGNPTPKWELEPGGDGLWLKLPFSAAYQVADSLVGSVATPKTTSKTTQERILVLLKAEPELTRRMLAERVGLTPNGLKYHLNKLRAAGAIRHVGPTRTGRWEVLTTPKTTQKTSQEQEKTREKILAMIAADPSITTAELANRLGITSKGIEWQISKLKQTGILKRIGPAKGGHWKVVETKDE